MTDSTLTRSFVINVLEKPDQFSSLFSQTKFLLIFLICNHPCIFSADNNFFDAFVPYKAIFLDLLQFEGHFLHEQTTQMLRHTLIRQKQTAKACPEWAIDGGS